MQCMVYIHLVMPKTTTFETMHPTTGQYAKRTSQNRTYTHAVWVRKTAAMMKASLEMDLRSATKYAAEYRAKAAAGGETFGYNKQHHHTPEQFLEWAAGQDKRAQAAKAKLDAGVEAGEWYVDGWCGRADLANSKASGLRSKGYDVAVSPAHAKTDGCSKAVA